MSQNKLSLDIETFKDLKSYFYHSLFKLNNKSLSPVPNEALLYSCDALERLTLTTEFFDVKENGKLTDKVLGLKILKAEGLESEQKKKIYKDVADTALVLVGYFSSSINNKLVDRNYYIKIGKMAYRKMDPYYPDYLDVPGFYKQLSHCFEGLTYLLNTFADTNKQDPLKHLLLDELDDHELLTRGILNTKIQKVS
jgi:hypothetical protein